jgi:hypothetical protein
MIAEGFHAAECPRAIGRRVDVIFGFSKNRKNSILN